MSVPEPTPRSAPLTTSQQFLAMFDKGPDQGSFGPRHIVSSAARISGSIDTATLREALNDVVVRHEALRTTIVRDAEPPYQEVLEPGTPHLEEHTLTADGDRDTAAHEFFNRMEAGRCPYDEQPLVRVELGRFDDEDAVLVVNAHHMVSDGWSLPIIIRDLAQFYAARRGFGEPELPEMAQYLEFAAWQQEHLASEAVDKARAYWREKLAGAAFVPLPTDRPRSDAIGVYTVHRFLLDHELTSATQLLAKELRASPFMVLFAAYTLMMHRVTGVTDLTLPTMTAGRNDPRFVETVGPIFNFLPLRTDLSDCRTYRDLLMQTRTTCLEMYANEIPFSETVAEAPHIVAAFEDLDKAVQAFQCFAFPSGGDSTVVGDIKVTEMRRRVLSAENTSDIPDGAVWALEILPEGEITCAIRYNTNEFDEETILATAADYRAILSAMVADVDAPLDAPLAA